jgi:plasmid maintenance system killer protein
MDFKEFFNKKGGIFMKTKSIILSILFGLFLLFSYYIPSYGSEATITGSVYFTCNFLSKYMAKHGYVFIGEEAKKNVFAAEDAEVIIKDMNGTVIGTARTDKKGNFSILVPEEMNYRIIVRFHDREKEYTVSYLEINNFTANLGYFNTDTVGNWIDAKLASR